MKFQAGNAEQWNNWNPILSKDRIGVELETSRYKVGDGVRRWSLLPYSTTDTFPRFRILDTWLEVLKDSTSLWQQVVIAAGRPGTNGVRPLNDVSGEATFYYKVTGGIAIPYTPPAPPPPSGDIADSPFSLDLALLYLSNKT